MLVTYRHNMKPMEEINALIALTENLPTTTLKKWQKLNSTTSDDIYIVLHGEMEFRRLSDDLCLFTGEQKYIFGLTSLFYQTQYTYGISRTEVMVRKISKTAFIQLLNATNSWPNVTKVFAWYLHLFNLRDEMLVARSAYAVIREFLLEINQLMIDCELDINVYDYIQQYTSLARSTIVKILSELKKGDYIEVKNGKLINLNSLPARY